MLQEEIAKILRF